MFLIRRPERRHRSRGQSLVEFALVFPIFMLILGGVIQFAVILWGQNTLNQVVRDAGRYVATVPDCSPASQTDAVAHTRRSHGTRRWRAALGRSR